MEGTKTWKLWEKLYLPNKVSAAPQRRGVAGEQRERSETITHVYVTEINSCG